MPLLIDNGRTLTFHCPECKIQLVLIKAAAEQMPFVVRDHYRESHRTAKLPNAIMALLSQHRPSNFHLVSPERKWEIDKELGILDWDGRVTDDNATDVRHS